MKTFLILTLALFSAQAFAQGQPTTAPTPSVAISGSVYPGPVLTAPAGTAVEVQFELVIGDQTRVRNFYNQPVSIRYYSYGGAEAGVSCDWTTARCKVRSPKPGAVRVNLSNAEGSWGYYGGSVVVNFTPSATSAPMGYREVTLPITSSTVQGTEGETITASVTFPQDFGGPDNPVELRIFNRLAAPGTDRNVYFPSGVRAGQRVALGKFDVLPQTQMGSHGLGVELKNPRTQLVVARGDSEYMVKSGYQAFTAKLDESGNITVSGQLPPDARYQMVLLRGDGFYLPLNTIQYQSGNHYELVSYNGSNAGGSEYRLPAGYYSIAVIGEFPGSFGGYSRVLTNGLYINQELTLR